MTTLPVIKLTIKPIMTFIIRPRPVYQIYDILYRGKSSLKHKANLHVQNLIEDKATVLLLSFFFLTMPQQSSGNGHIVYYYLCVDIY